MAYILGCTNEIDMKYNEMTLDMSEFEFLLARREWKRGVMIQDAFPNLNADEREFIMTGITPALWDYVFGSGEGQEET